MKELLEPKVKNCFKSLRNLTKFLGQKLPLIAPDSPRYRKTQEQQIAESGSEISHEITQKAKIYLRNTIIIITLTRHEEF